jgi:hypothetical protein
MDNDEIIAMIEEHESNAYGINDTTLSEDRAKAIEYYLGEPYGNELEGRSQVVTSEVQDTIESALPQLLKIFVSGDEIVRFNPKNAEDIKASEQETEYINYVVMEKNQGYQIFYTWFKDALLSKNGYIKVYYEEQEEVENESYQGLTDAQIQMLGSDKNVQILEHETYPDEQAEQQKMLQIQQAMQSAQSGDQQALQAIQQLEAQPPVMLHNVKISVTETKGKICIKNVAPENMMVSVDTPATNLQEGTFKQHREFMRREELEKQGFKVPDGLEINDNFDVESQSRDIYDEEYIQSFAGLILVKDTYLKVDGKLMRYVVVGNNILHQEEAEIVPICCITPHLMPHRHIGRSYADLTMSDQLVGSTLLRGMLDSMYLANSPRHAISDKVNMDDLLVSRPGGIVRTGGQPAGEIIPLVAPPPSPTSFNLIELLDSKREKKTGVVSYNQGLDSDSLNKTKGGMQMIMNAAQERLSNVARLFAETGVKDLFIMVHRLVRMNYTKPDIVRLRNEWIEVDPRQWKTRNDMSITVGLGTGNKDQQLQHLMTLLQVQEKALMLGIATPKNIYHSCIKLTQNAGFKDAEEFFTDPSNQQPQQPKPDPDMLKVQADMQESKERLEMDKQKAVAEFSLEKWKAEQDVELERYKAELKAKAELEIQQTKAAMQASIEQTKLEIDSHRQSVQQMHEIAIKRSEHDESTEALREERQTKLLEAMATVADKLSKPKKVIRDANGKLTGVE